MSEIEKYFQRKNKVAELRRLEVAYYEENQIKIAVNASGFSYTGQVEKTNEHGAWIKNSERPASFVSYDDMVSVSEKKINYYE